MSSPVRPVLLEEPQARQKWVNPDGTPTHYGQRWHHAVFMRLGAYNDDVWRALGVGFTGLTQINQVSQRVADVEAATAAVQGAVAGLRGDPRLDAAVEALTLATTALAQVQARASGEAEKRIGDIEKLVASLGARLTKSQQNVQMQIDRMAADVQSSQQLQVMFVQRTASDQMELAEEIEVINDKFAGRVYDALSATAPLTFNDTTGEFALNASLTSLGGLSPVAGRFAYATGADTWTLGTITAFGRSILDDADAATVRSTLGLGNLATADTINNGDWSGADLAVANGGTGASDAATARQNLGLEIGVDVAAYQAPEGGWSAATGTADRTTFDTATVTLPELAERVKALIDDLLSHQTLGA